jgi:L-lactate dehydrogenase complex protein LldG
MTTVESHPPVRRGATWRVAAAEPRNTWRVTAAADASTVATDADADAGELAWQLSLTVRARLGITGPVPATSAMIETTATEEPLTWSVPPGVVTDAWRAQAPVARRIAPSRLAGPPSGDAGGVSPRDPDADADADPPEREPEPDTGSADPPESSSEALAPMPYPPSDNEHGDRTLFLALARQRLAGGIPLNMVHPPPVREPLGSAQPPAPEPTYTNLDRDDLLGSFARAVEEAGGVCHQVVGEVPDILLDRLVAELDAWDVVVSQDPEAVALGERLADRGVDVSTAGREATADATLGVTSAVAAIAATGSVVIDSARSGGRLSSVLPPAHLCVLPVERLVATPGDVLRRLGDEATPLPSSLVLVTGPSRTGDIEQLLTIGAHGPTTLHVVVVSPPPPATTD